MRRLDRTQWAALAGVVVLLGGALVLRGREAGPAPADGRLTALRTAAALEPCPPGLGAALPAFTLPCLGGGADVDLSAPGPARPTLVNVWATWCPPCVREVPTLVQFAELAGDRVGLVGVLTQDTPENGLEFSLQMGIRYPSIVDPDGEVYRANRPGPPVTLFLDATGRVVFRQNGELKSLQQLRALVATHLGVAL